MKKISPTYARLLFSTLLCAATAGALMYVYAHIREAESFVMAVNGDLTEAGLKEKQARIIKQQIFATAEKRTSVEELSLTKEDVADFIASIEALGKATGVSLSVGSVAASGSGVLRTLTVEVAAEGSLSQTLRFLELIETHPRATRISVASLEQGEKKLTLRFTVHSPLRS